MQTNEYEVGGFLDYGKKSKKITLERFISYIGNEASVQIPESDYEIDWHIHPPRDDGRAFDPPSSDDMFALLEDNIETDTQISLVFATEGVYVMKPTSVLIGKYKGMSQDEQDDFEVSVRELLDFMWENAATKRDVDEFFKAVKKTGFSIRLHPYTKPLNMLIRLHN